MIDKKGRKKFAELLRHFAAGRITNDEFEDTWPGMDLKIYDDKGLNAIVDSSWCLYGGCRYCIF